MNQLCAVKDLTSKDWLLIGRVQAKIDGMILVMFPYTVKGPDTEIWDVFGGCEVVQTKQLKQRSLWFREQDVILDK